MAEQIYPNALTEGTVLKEQYKIKKVLGQGGFGITYLAVDMNLDLEVAIKEYYPEGMVTRNYTSQQVTIYAKDQQDQYKYGEERFLEEARVLAKLQDNEYIIGIKNFFRENGTAYFVMDYVKGISFKAYLESMSGRILYQDALALLMPIMDALKEVHALGLLHRDISPDNIYITNEGKSKLLDFGAARGIVGEKSKSLSVILKPGYAPEEQYRSKGKQGPWTDVYALAATLYVAITGQLPPESLDRLDHDELMMPNEKGIDIPNEIENALKKALAIKAYDRYQNVEELKNGLLGKNNDTNRQILNMSQTEMLDNTISKSDEEKENKKRFCNSRLELKKVGVCLAGIIILLIVAIGIKGASLKVKNQTEATIGIGADKKVDDLKQEEENLKYIELTEDIQVGEDEEEKLLKDTARKEIDEISTRSYFKHSVKDNTNTVYDLYFYAEDVTEDIVLSETEFKSSNSAGDRMVTGKLKIAYLSKDEKEVIKFDLFDDMKQELLSNQILGDWIHEEWILRTNIMLAREHLIKNKYPNQSDLFFIEVGYDRWNDKYYTYNMIDGLINKVDFEANYGVFSGGTKFEQISETEFLAYWQYGDEEWKNLSKWRYEEGDFIRVIENIPEIPFISDEGALSIIKMAFTTKEQLFDVEYSHNASEDDFSRKTSYPFDTMNRFDWHMGEFWSKEYLEKEKEGQIKEKDGEIWITYPEYRGWYLEEGETQSFEEETNNKRKRKIIYTKARIPAGQLFTVKFTLDYTKRGWVLRDEGESVAFIEE